MSIKLYRAANKVMKKKIWRDKQISLIVSDLSNLEDVIRSNWNTVGYIERDVLHSANDYIVKYLNTRDKKVVSLVDWIQEINVLADERAAFSSCLR